MWDTPDSVMKAELGQSERLLWAGQPKQGIALQGSDVFMIPFSLMWGGFAIVWETISLLMFFAAAEPIAIIFPLFGLPFVLIGLYMIFGRFIVDAKRRARTFYGLTDQRVIVVSGLFGRNIKSMNLRTLSDVSLSEKTDRTGTITFGPTHPMSAWFGTMSWPAMPQGGPSFEMIPDAKKIYEQVREAQAKT